MNWSVLLLLFVFCLQSALTRGQNRNPWSSSVESGKWITYFLQSLSKSNRFTSVEINTMETVADALLASVDDMISRGKFSAPKMQAMNMAFASSIAQMIIAEEEGSSLAGKRDAVINAMHEAFMQTSGLVNQKYLDEIRNLINMFSQTDANEIQSNSEEVVVSRRYGSFKDSVNASPGYSSAYANAQGFNRRVGNTQLKKYPLGIETTNQMNKNVYDVETNQPRILSSGSSAYFDQIGQNSIRNSPRQEPENFASPTYGVTNVDNGAEGYWQRAGTGSTSSSKTTSYNKADISYDKEGTFPVASDSKTDLRSAGRKYRRGGRFSDTRTYGKKRQGPERRRFRSNQRTEFTTIPSTVISDEADRGYEYSGYQSSQIIDSNAPSSLTTTNSGRSNVHSGEKRYKSDRESGSVAAPATSLSLTNEGSNSEEEKYSSSQQLKSPGLPLPGSQVYGEADMNSGGNGYSSSWRAESSYTPPSKAYDDENRNFAGSEYISEQNEGNSATLLGTVNPISMEKGYESDQLEGSSISKPYGTYEQARPSATGGNFVSGNSAGTSTNSFSPTFNQLGSHLGGNRFNQQQGDVSSAVSAATDDRIRPNYKDRDYETETVGTELSREDYDTRMTNEDYSVFSDDSTALQTLSSSSRVKGIVNINIQGSPASSSASRAKYALSVLLNSVPNIELLSNVISDIYSSIITNNPNLSECELSIRVLLEIIAALVQIISSSSVGRVISPDNSSAVEQSVPPVVC